ncbi:MULTISPECIES: hypothetical protein [unclassified Anabaena]|uniref:hypothetical protein n=1 Tax=unclassified Anabaena TaxID=2619674 RepID=UPI0039C61C0B
MKSPVLTAQRLVEKLIAVLWKCSIISSLLKIIVHKVVLDRPARSEPRVTKRRPKAYPRLTKPRQELRKQLQTA